MKVPIEQERSEAEKKIHALYWIIGILVAVIIALAIFLTISVTARHMRYEKGLIHPGQVQKSLLKAQRDSSSTSPVSSLQESGS